MRIYSCDSCYKTISNPYIVKMKEFHIGVDTNCLRGLCFPVESKRKVKIHLCDECYKGLNLIGELVPEKSKKGAKDNV